MYNINILEIKDKITSQHEGDENQLEVIFSEGTRLIVEAPAGYGKTTTMISRIAYLFAVGKIPNPKRILGLTFSVNAALKVKREVAGKLPVLIGGKNSPIVIGEKATITNYHGFCKGILKKYGYLMTPILRKDVNLFKAVGDGEVKNQSQLLDVLTTDELEYLENIENVIKSAEMPELGAIHAYNDIISQKFLPLDFITHNAIILIVLEMFDRYPEVKKFYQNFYPLIVVDEFQDTNCIAWALLKAIISDCTQLLFLGDPLQRIYGFIGALPNIMTVAAEEYNMTKIVLSKNYRFRDNPEMLELDRIIRDNAATVFNSTNENGEEAELPGFWGKNQQDEAEQIVEKVRALIGEGAEKIALLFRSRGNNVGIVEHELLNKGIPYFYGMFSDEDPDYVEFHNTCQDIFIRRFGKTKSISQKKLISFSESIKAKYTSSNGKAIDSLLKLLDALIDKVTIDYAVLLPEDKYTFLLDIFENRQLKQAMEYVDAQVILSTVHGAKGLEWDYVIIGDVERKIFPGYFTCSECKNELKRFPKPCCELPHSLPETFIDTIIDELSVFYVGVTRVKKQVYVSASAKRLNKYGKEEDSIYSCMTRMKGIKLTDAQTYTNNP